MHLYRLSLFFGMIWVVAILGCVANPEETSCQVAQNGGEAKNEPKQVVETKKVPVGNNVFLEVQGENRRVLIESQVCLRRGILEQLLTKKGTKEHEAVLAADIDARNVHLALTLTKAEPGKPVQFAPKFVPPSGTTIKVFLEYEQEGKKVRVPAQSWLRSLKTKKVLDVDWVFAGSYLLNDQLDNTKKPFYGANTGDVICIANFDSAMLDLPFASPKDNDDLFFEAFTDRIPPEKTPVLVILEPVLEKKKN